MHFPLVLSAVAAFISLPMSISAQAGQFSYLVSDCDGTNAATYYANAKNIENPECVQWPDGNFINNERAADATAFDCNSKLLDVSPNIH